MQNNSLVYILQCSRSETFAGNSFIVKWPKSNQWESRHLQKKLLYNQLAGCVKYLSSPLRNLNFHLYFSLTDFCFIIMQRRCYGSIFCAVSYERWHYTVWIPHFPKTEYCKGSISYRWTQMWNSLPENLRSAKSKSILKRNPSVDVKSSLLLLF